MKDDNPFKAFVNPDWLLAAYDYTLPEEQIAQTPAFPRDSARLLVVKDGDQFAHAVFRDLPNLLRPGDLLVLNNTRVLPARLHGHKASGLAVEVLLLEPQPEANCWLALVKPGRRLKPGTQIFFGTQQGQGDKEVSSPAFPSFLSSPSSPPCLTATVMATDSDTSGRILQFEVPPGESLEALIQQLGEMPLPPYITSSGTDPEDYQTIYASRLGAAAAPTAGLHFTPELLEDLQQRGIQQAFVTLHVGVGTFRPVEVEEIISHRMHGEWVEVPAETVEQIKQTKARGGRVIAVGTTAVRSLEAAGQSGTLQPFQDKTDLFIYPGYQWQVVDGLITNFHLPKSSLLMLVSAFMGRQRLLDFYQVAIAAQYRFYSFGDAMLILPEAAQFGVNGSEE
jgi:S-adenosylmethionine:tRNA ribosyltransferase-isomerase